MARQEVKKVKGIKYTIEYIQRLSDLEPVDIQDALETLRCSGQAEIVDIDIVMVER